MSQNDATNAQEMRTPRMAVRWILVVVASLAMYAFGSYWIIQYFHQIQHGNSYYEWSDSTQRIFLAALWVAPVVALAAAGLLARKLRVPVLASIGATAAVIGVLWLTYWMNAR